MARIATGESVKINTEISKDDDQIIRDYQIAKTKRFGEKVTKAEACSEVISFGIGLAKNQIDQWETEIENFKNQK